MTSESEPGRIWTIFARSWLDIRLNVEDADVHVDFFTKEEKKEQNFSCFDDRFPVQSNRKSFTVINIVTQLVLLLSTVQTIWTHGDFFLRSLQTIVTSHKRRNERWCNDHVKSMPSEFQWITEIVDVKSVCFIRVEKLIKLKWHFMRTTSNYVFWR